MAKHAPLCVHKRADKTDQSPRVKHPEHGRFVHPHPETGEPTDELNPYPLAGVLVGSHTDPKSDPPEATRVPTSFVAGGRAEGWISVEGERLDYAPGGPPEDPTRVVHGFVQLDAFTIHASDGDVRYRVVHQPGKYDEEPSEENPSGKRVDNFYDVELDNRAPDKGENG